MTLAKVSTLDKLSLANVLVFITYLNIDMFIIKQSIYWMDSLFTVAFLAISIYLYKMNVNKEGQIKFFNKKLAKAFIIVFSGGAVIYLLFMYNRLR